MDKPSKLEEYLYLVEFSYNNGNHSSLKTSPFEAFYDKECNASINWSNPIDKVVLAPYFLKDIKEKMVKIK